MFRRVVSALAVLSLLASQWARVPHAHSRMTTEERQKHDATPHVHLPLGMQAGHSHGHHHSHAHQGGHQHVSGTHHASASVPQAFSATGSDHEADVVYLPHALDAPAITNGQAVANGSWHVSLQHPIATWEVLLGVNAREWNCWHPPDLMVDAARAPIYLTLRTLRI